MIYKVDFGGQTLKYKLRDPAVRIEFGRYMTPSEGGEYDVYSTDANMERMRGVMPPGTSDYIVEFRSLLGPTSLALLPKGRCLFHAVSFVYRGKAWLLCGPSGVGKTTQYRNWMKRFPGEIEIICGDMPALEAREDGSVWVHPSPWNGKERFGAPDGSAELMGIVRLVQAKANEFEPLAPAEAVVPLLRQFAVRPETAGQIRLLAAIAEKVLSSAPAMLYRNRGDLESTEILRSKFDELLERK